MRRPGGAALGQATSKWRDQLPNLLVIGAMKCGTSALHSLLSRHPQIFMTHEKELNFFTGMASEPEGDADGVGSEGHSQLGLAQYADHFVAGIPVRGESSPGYTSPSYPETAGRISRVLPQVRLVYLVRDPLDRAVSQWRHHVRDGTERRPVEEALLDPGSQYISRSRFAERLAPYRACFPQDQILVVVQERLRRDADEEVCRVLRHVGADSELWPGTGSTDRAAPGDRRSCIDPAAAREFVAAVADDARTLTGWMNDDVPEWRSLHTLR